LEKLLEENQLVSITVGRQARRTRQVDFFNGKLTIATGPAFLSHRTKAPLLPVFTIRESNQDYVVTVEPPLCGAGSKDVDSHIEMAVTKYVALLEQYALKHPAQFFNGYPSMCDI
jgi:lauroyl/myristoyl acyltransferase